MEALESRGSFSDRPNCSSAVRGLNFCIGSTALSTGCRFLFNSAGLISRSADQLPCHEIERLFNMYIPAAGANLKPARRGIGNFAQLYNVLRWHSF
jgi:hypothetical protein